MIFKFAKLFFFRPLFFCGGGGGSFFVNELYKIIQIHELLHNDRICVTTGVKLHWN